MRAVSLAVVFALAAAAPALAQSPGFRQQMDAQLRVDQLRALQNLAERQAVVQRNEVSNLEFQMRAAQAAATLESQSRTPRLPPPAGAAASIDAGQIASMPDADLAASNARVRAAAENRP